MTSPERQSFIMLGRALLRKLVDGVRWGAEEARHRVIRR